MSHERYTSEERVANPFRNPEWQAFKDRKFRFPNQFGGVGDNGDGTPRDTPVFFHRDGNGEAVVVPGVNIQPDEVKQLIERGVTFPLEIAQPCPAVPFQTEAEVFRGIRKTEITNGRGQTIGYDTTAE